MPIRDMGAFHLAAQGGSFEPQRQNSILLRIFGLMYSDLVTLSLETFPLPKTALAPIELNYLNQRRKVAGTANVEDIELVCKDFIDNPTLAILTDWWLQTYDPYTGRIGLARNYKKTGTITMYGPEGGFDREYVLVGLWINNFDPGDADHTSEDKKPITCTLSCDNALPSSGIFTRTHIEPGGAFAVEAASATSIAAEALAG